MVNNLNNSKINKILNTVEYFRMVYEVGTKEVTKHRGTSKSSGNYNYGCFNLSIIRFIVIFWSLNDNLLGQNSLLVNVLSAWAM